MCTAWTTHQAPTAVSAAPPAWRRLLLSVFGDPRFSTAMRWLLIIMSGIMVSHNLFLRSWGIGTFPSITRRIIMAGEAGGFGRTPLFDAEGKPTFLRYARSPAGRFLHILPAGLWSVIAPLQLSPTFRSKYRAVHRCLGRIFIAMSVSMTVGLVPLTLSGATTLGSSVVAIGLLQMLNAYFLVTAVLAISHARNKRLAKHRVWILRHVAMGYSVHLQRLLGYLTWGAFPALIPGYTDRTPEGARLRSFIFGLYFCIGVFLSVGSMELWLRHTTSSGKALQEKTEKTA